LRRSPDAPHRASRRALPDEPIWLHQIDPIWSETALNPPQNMVDTTRRVLYPLEAQVHGRGQASLTRRAKSLPIERDFALHFCPGTMFRENRATLSRETGAETGTGRQSGARTQRKGVRCLDAESSHHAPKSISRRLSGKPPGGGCHALSGPKTLDRARDSLALFPPGCNRPARRGGHPVDKRPRPLAARRRGNILRSKFQA
jgi:hypothetical protein